MRTIEIPEMTAASEQQLLELTQQLADLQAKAVTELVNRTTGRAEYNKRLGMLPPWRQAVVKTLSSKALILLVVIVVGGVSVLSNLMEFANNSADIQDVVKQKADELKQAEAAAKKQAE